MYLVTQLVRQDDFDFVCGKFSKQRIAQDDPAGISQSSQRRIGSLGPLAHVEFVDSAYLCLDLFRQLQKALFQVGVFLSQWLEFVKQGK